MWGMVVLAGVGYGRVGRRGVWSCGQVWGMFVRGGEELRPRQMVRGRAGRATVKESGRKSSSRGFDLLPLNVRADMTSSPSALGLSISATQLACGAQMEKDLLREHDADTALALEALRMTQQVSIVSVGGGGLTRW